jgi:hypothetical protein
MNTCDEKITWTRWPEAVKLFLRGVTIRTAIPIALFVGSILSIINQSHVFAQGTATFSTWLRIGLNFVVPFCVSSYSVLVAAAQTHKQETGNQMYNRHHGYRFHEIAGNQPSGL